ncbi:hypothetical protein F3Y22_tig00014445pilonHSYRG00004 [Hibiscus syriacus]|uniref:Uncharacterized protein n=1 Tax=Hibiscus syriacus TaxID=106335 RepID=A0A6A3C4P9_HIBSY|nr:hypothetical protein F3Y22_tig00014445pilonHSYRG00004 [Hibiscus syriacus]
MVLGLADNSEFDPSKIPSSFKNLTKLKTLWMSGTSLVGEISDFITDVTTLELLDLSSNRLTGEIPNALLSGTLPRDLGRYLMLKRFKVCSNKLTWTLAKHLCDGVKLLGVIAFDNNLTGELPTSLGNCNSFRNGLTGSIPSGLSTSLNLSMLMISDNMFTGELPRRVSDNLSRLEINYNGFSEEFPLK